MRPAPKEEPKARRIVAAFLTIAILAIAGVSVWYAVVRPITWQEVMEGESWSPGYVRDLQGTISSVLVVNTSYGRQIVLGLEAPQSECDGFAVYGDPNGTYRVGDPFRTTLRFQGFRIGGVPAVWAPELACPVPGLWNAIGGVLDAVALVTGIGLVFVSTEGGGWTTYELATTNGDRYPANRLPVSLLAEPFDEVLDVARIDSADEWIRAAATEYVLLTGGYRPDWEIDGMAALSEGTSPGGRIRFLDTDSDGLVGDRDRIQVRLDPTGADYQPYFLVVGAGITARPPSVTGGFTYILHGPRGPYHWFPDATRPPWLQLAHLSEFVGTTATSRLEIGRVMFAPPRPTGEYEFVLRIDDRDAILGPVRDDPVVLPGDVTVDHWDRTGNGLLDAGDRFDVTGLPIHSHMQFDLSHSEGSHASIGWFAGYGHVGGRIPDVDFVIPIPWSVPSSIGSTVSNWHPEFAFGKTLTVSLHEESVLVMDRIPLAPGLLGTWPAGTLSFADADGDGVWSTGDDFILDGSPTARYQIEVSLLFGWRTFSVDLGP